MLQYYDDPDKRFRTLIDDVSHQIESTNFSDAKIAEICFTSAEFVRRHRKFLSLGPYAPLIKEDKMARGIKISKDDLYREYIENEKTIAECAEFFGCSNGPILRNMEKHGIQVRPKGPQKKSDTKEIATPGPKASPDVVKALKAHPEAKKQNRFLERLLFLSAVKETSIQELLEEALELLFEKYNGEET